MKKSDYTIKIIKVSTIIFVVGLIVFAALYNINNSLMSGWAAGFFAVMSSYFFSILLNKLLINKVRSKWKAGLLTVSRVFGVFIIHTLCFFALMAVDKHFSGMHILDKGTESLMSPINLYTYLGGIGIIAFGTVASLVWKNKGEKNG